MHNQTLSSITTEQMEFILIYLTAV